MLIDLFTRSSSVLGLSEMLNKCWKRNTCWSFASACHWWTALWTPGRIVMLYMRPWLSFRIFNTCSFWYLFFIWCFLLWQHGLNLTCIVAKKKKVWQRTMPNINTKLTFVKLYGKRKKCLSPFLICSGGQNPQLFLLHFFNIVYETGISKRAVGNTKIKKFHIQFKFGPVPIIYFFISVWIAL